MGCDVAFAELAVFCYCSGVTMDGIFYQPMSQLEDAIIALMKPGDKVVVATTEPANITVLRKYLPRYVPIYVSSLISRLRKINAILMPFLSEKFLRKSEEKKPGHQS